MKGIFHLNMIKVEILNCCEFQYYSHFCLSLTIFVYTLGSIVSNNGLMCGAFVCVCAFKGTNVLLKKRNSKSGNRNI